MNKKQINLVHTSFSLLSLSQARLAELFYQRLFFLAPQLRPLFKKDMTAQGEKLMRMLATAINSLHDIERLKPTLETLGRDHVTYGVKAKHYDLVGDALLWTLKEGLGSHFNAETEDAWLCTYTILSTIMMEAGQKPAKG